MDEHAEQVLPATSNLPTDAPWWARWLVADAKAAWRWASVRFGVAIAIVAEVYATDPADVQKVITDIVPVSWWPHIIALAGVLSVTLRVINLKGK